MPLSLWVFSNGARGFAVLGNGSMMPLCLQKEKYKTQPPCSSLCEQQFKPDNLNNLVKPRWRCHGFVNFCKLYAIILSEMKMLCCDNDRIKQKKIKRLCETRWNESFTTKDWKAAQKRRSQSFKCNIKSYITVCRNTNVLIFRDALWSDGTKFVLFDQNDHHYIRRKMLKLGNLRTFSLEF